MIRLYRPMLAPILVALKYVELVGQSLPSIRKALYQHLRERREVSDSATATALDFVAQDLDNAELWTNLQDLITQLSAQFMQGEGSNDVDLVDTIVEYLNLPYVRNHLGINQLKELRTAILLPDELAKLKLRLAKLEPVCVECGHIFAEGEMATFTRESNTVAFYCRGCITPTMWACAGCRHTSILIDDKIRGAITAKPSKTPCGHTKDDTPHQGQRVGPIDPPNATPPAWRTARAGRLEVNLNMGRPAPTQAQAVQGTETVWTTQHAPPPPAVRVTDELLAELARINQNMNTGTIMDEGEDVIDEPR